MTPQRHSADEPPSWRHTYPRAKLTNDELRQQIIDLHQLGTDRSATASPLARQLIEAARSGTYERLAPLIAAADPSWNRAPSSAARTQPATPVQVDEETVEPTTAKPEARHHLRVPKFMTKLFRRDS
ncbi:hypothetical protein AU196_12640 [Mycobacterium sp. IS-1742]|uniref:hypothetical protein n=1 Tax=Mycobacterium sp. IS-1742 TaxID=1772285 RepID=UPI00074055A3|nr:hypothetical protein [Mycobacterium sp. IS-1742]KUI33139.1 hypothetical protein AU196_12640 [Mycobacterium sp. IS-1742]